MGTIRHFHRSMQENHELHSYDSKIVRTILLLNGIDGKLSSHHVQPVDRLLQSSAQLITFRWIPAAVLS
jgi:hypothetical protein